MRNGIGTLIDRALRWDTIVHDSDPCEVQEETGDEECPEQIELYAAIDRVRRDEIAQPRRVKADRAMRDISRILWPISEEDPLEYQWSSDQIEWVADVLNRAGWGVGGEFRPRR